MKKFTLFLLSMFCMLGTALAQDNDDEAFALQYTSPNDGATIFSVNFIQLGFNKDVTVALPEGGIEVKNNETGEGIKLTRVYEDPYMSKNMVMLMFEQKTVIDEKDGKEVVVDQFINTPGTYSYTIPAGVITSVDGEVFPEQTFTFTIATLLPIASVTPNSATTMLDKIVFTFESNIAKVNIPQSGMFIVNNYWETVAKIKDEAIISEDKKSVTLELETPITTPGAYALDVYNGIFVSEDGGINEYASYYFQIIDTKPSYSTNYEDGDKVKELGNLEITFKNVKEVKLVEGAGKVVVYMPGGSEAEGTASLADNKITVTFDQDMTEEGIYWIHIPAGMFTMDGAENEERLLEVTLFKFEITPLEIVSITPVEGNVEQLDRIIIEFNQKVTLSFDENWQMISGEIVLKGENKDYILTYNSMSNLGNKLEYLVNAEWSGYEYTSTPITEAGTYTLNLADVVVDYAAEDGIDDIGYPATIWHEKNKSLEGTFTWTIVKDETGIESVGAENAVKVIYDLTGRRIENITNAGIYIVNGKKVIVK